MGTLNHNTKSPDNCLVSNWKPREQSSGRPLLKIGCLYTGQSRRSHDVTYLFWHTCWNHMSLVMRKPTFCICENKDADQLRGNREADRRLCFCYNDSTIPLLPKYQKFQASSHILWVYSLVCVGTGRKPQRQVFSQRGSYVQRGGSKPT